MDEVSKKVKNMQEAQMDDKTNAKGINLNQEFGY